MMPPTRRNLSWERFLGCKDWILDPQDTISRLPEGVKHHILSFLPPEDKNQLKLLSRSWRLLWSRSKKKIRLGKLRLDDQQFSPILQDYFPSAEFFSLSKCSGIENLNLASNNLREIKLYKCSNLEKVKLTTPNLESFDFFGSLHKPCIVELGATMHLNTLHLVGVHIDETMFSHCDTTFPVLWGLTIDSCHYTSKKINISSRSLKTLTISGLRKRVDISIDAPELFYVGYIGHLIANLSNLNLTSVKNARIELKPNAKHEPNSLWFKKLVDMIQGFNPDEMLVLITNSDKNIIIPEEIKRSIVPPVRGPKAVFAELENLPNNNVDLIDAMLWISPRAEYLRMIWERFLGSLWLVHGEMSGAGALGGHSCCPSYPGRCWRHSLVECIVDAGDEKWEKDVASYFKESVEKASRLAYEEQVLETIPNEDFLYISSTWDMKPRHAASVQIRLMNWE